VSYDTYIISRGIITERYLYEDDGFSGPRNVDETQAIQIKSLAANASLVKTG